MRVAAHIPLSPFALNEPYGHTSFTDTTGKTTESLSLTPGEKVLVLLGLGNSIQSNDRPSAFNPSTNQSKIQQISIHDGLCYRAAGALLGANGSNGNGLAQLGEKVLGSANNPFDRFICLPLGRSGTPISYRTYRGGLDHHLRVALRRLKAAGLLEANEDISHAVLGDHGQTDATDGVSAANYQAYWREIAATCAAAGFNAKFFVNKTTMNNNVVNATIQGAQTGLVDNVTFFAAADVDSLTGATNRRADGTHLENAGYGNKTDLELAAIDAAY